MKALLYLLCLFALPSLAKAGCEYRYPTIDHAPQLYSLTQSGTPAGLLPAIAARLQQETGCAFQPLELPLARRNVMLQQGQLQFMLLAVRNAALEQHAEFVPLFQVPLRVTVLANSQFRYADELFQEQPYRLGAPRGALFPPDVEQKLDGLRAASRLEYSDDRNSMYLKLAHGRLSAILETAAWLNNNLTADGLAVRFIDFQPPMFVAVGCYLSQHMAEADRQQLRTALQSLLKRKEIEPIVLRYLPQLRGQLHRS